MGASLLVAHSHAGTAFTTTGGPTTVLVPYGTIIATTANYDWRLRGTSGGTVSELRAYASANTTTTATCTLTARLNGSNQSLSLSWSAGQTGEKQDTTNSFSVSDGDDIDYAFVRGSESSKAITIQSISVRFDADTSGDTISLVGCANATGTPFNTASTTRYITPSYTEIGSSERAVRCLGDYTFGNLYVYVAGNARTTTTTFRSRVNGANGAQSVSYTSGQSGLKEDTTNTDSIASGDDFCWSITTGTGTSTIDIRAISSTAVSADGEFDLFIGRNVGAGYTSSSTAYLALGGGISTAGSTEANAQTRGFAADYYNLRGSVSSNTSNGTTTVTFRIEGADAGPTISWTSGQTGTRTDTSNTASCADDDLIGFKIVNAGTGTCTITYLAITGATSSGGSALTIDLDDSVTASDSLGKAAGLAKSDSATASDAAGKAVSKALADTATAADSATKALSKTIADTASPVDALAKAATLAKADTASASDALSKAPGIAIADTASAEDALAKLVALALADSASVADAVAKVIAIAIADVASAGDVLAKAAAKTIADGATASDSASAVVPVIYRRIAGDVTISRGLAGDVRIPRTLHRNVRISRGISGTVEV